MDTKSKAERFLNMMTGDESMLAQDGIEVAQAYLDQCQEVDRLKGLLSQANGFVRTYGEGPYYEGQDTVVKLTVAIDEALKEQQ